MNTAGSVKQERQDEAEIRELAAKLVEANRAKMSTGIRPPMPPAQQVSGPSGMDAARTLGDEDSVRGRFGWTNIGKSPIPVLTRSGESYCAVRMVEIKVLNKYLSFLHQDIYNCTCIRSYYITEAEGRLLNEINCKHCDYQFGREQFSSRDLIVRFSDAMEFYCFLDTCYNKLMNASTGPMDRCGFIRINKESVVPYTVYNAQKYVPLFYFEGETENLKQRADKLEGWDLSYLKFCCKVQGIRNELFAHDSCTVISLDDIKNYFPPGTLFEDYWPSKVVDSRLLISGKMTTQMGQWTRQPAGPPVAPTHPPPSQKPATQAKPVTNNQMPGVSAMYNNYGAQQSYSAAPPRAPSAPIRSTYPGSVQSSRQQQAARPYYSNMTHNQTPAPPPLIRAGSTAAVYSTGQTAASSSSYMMLEPALAQASYRQTAPQMHKYPPPLIPVRHLNGGLRYDPPQNHYTTGDVVDLSGANRQLTRSVLNSTQATHQQIINQQPAHQQPPRSQSTSQENRSNMTNGRMSVTLNDLQRKLIPISEPPTSGSHIPYKIQKALVEGKMIPCINMKPYVYTELLVTLPDLVTNFFNNVPVQSCHQVMDVLGIEVYKGNNSQMRVLLENGKCQSMVEIVPMVQVRNVIDYMPQLKYMLGGLGSDVASKRQRNS